MEVYLRTTIFVIDASLGNNPFHFLFVEPKGGLAAFTTGFASVLTWEPAKDKGGYAEGDEQDDSHNYSYEQTCLGCIRCGLLQKTHCDLDLPIFSPRLSLLRNSSTSIIKVTVTVSPIGFGAILGFR